MWIDFIEVMMVLSIISALFMKEHTFAVYTWALIALKTGITQNTFFKFYAIINVCVFCLYSYDKSVARMNGEDNLNRRRIPENTLLLSSVFGIIGAYAGIAGLNHKINKQKFQFCIPLITIIELLLYAVFNRIFK